MKKVQLLFGIHDHQPVGNFDHVFRMAFDRCYRPFLDVFSQYPLVRASIHTTGPLLEWLDAHEPGYLDLIRALVAQGRVEILGGGFYEPILPSIPERDAIGQLKMMAAWTEKRFGQRPTGMWLAERVWDPYLPRVLSKAGMRFTVLDDTHFRAAGLKDEEMVGYFLTEREGDAVGIYPIDKNLRYKIPFAPVGDVIDYLRTVAREPSEGQPIPAVTYADDGEKFGLWPDTYKWVYDDRWLAKFFQALSDNADWLETKTIGSHFATATPTGRLYLPTASYDEMMEWALPAARIGDFEEAAHAEGKAKPFIRGGFWPNFMVKYPEANWMNKRASFASAGVAKAMGGDAAVVAAASATPPEMLKKLWRAQCNCGYWHGLFGGLYLNYIRHANYSNLLEAERMVEERVRSREDHLEHELVDIDRDGREEMAVTGALLNGFLKPDYGGALVELDFKPKVFHLNNALSRRFEAYHVKLSQAPGGAATHDDGRPKTIHDIVRVKEPGLEKKLRYDRYLRYGFLDHFLGEDATLSTFADQSYHETGWFAGAPYRVVSADFAGAKDAASVTLARSAEVEVGSTKAPIELEKTYLFSRRSPSLTVRYRITNRGSAPASLRFGVETNFSLLAGHADDRFFEVPGATLADRKLASFGTVAGAEGVDMVDRWAGFRIRMSFPAANDLWRHPVETVNQSEGGFEATYQASCVMPVWRFTLSAGETIERTFGVTIADA